ncbi:MAG: VOC family protein [Rhodospirillaceae bacterium]|jgi:catechol 2,3-dioxygenase-like lactoylglutathione lyase family enzyme|nr:VOC family protein [Rhodospirillaceae bacterium]MBT5240185.1 VOC family protein [Rhodospirillaceae bacterium]MBT5566964.1 VOC family protein [Rhodospirillaceae bacterium]MBT6090349.1 VOC family protein [Rhodospirillaceae bacterium]MBT7450512.1 VOC family protein [Rhodospirillaceae bacterium]
MVRRIIRSVQLAVTACAVIGLFIVSGQTPLLAQETAVRRTTLLVEDIGRSIDFYQRLGLTPWYEKSTSDTDEGGVIGALDLPLTADPKFGRIVIMRGNHDRIGMIGLLGYERPPLANARGNLVGIGVGDVIIMVETDDINFVFNRLQETGARFHRPPERFEITNPDGSVRDTGYRMFVYDPDGHLIEVSEPSEREPG